MTKENAFTTGPKIQTVAHLSYCRALVMADLRSRCGHHIFALWFLPLLLHGRPMK